MIYKPCMLDSLNQYISDIHNAGLIVDYMFQHEKEYLKGEHYQQFMYICLLIWKTTKYIYGG